MSPPSSPPINQVPVAPTPLQLLYQINTIPATSTNSSSLNMTQLNSKIGLIPNSIINMNDSGHEQTSPQEGYQQQRNQGSPCDTTFTQLLPQLHPMRAVPISVSASSHGPPQFVQQRKASISSLNDTYNPTGVFGGVTGPIGGVLPMSGVTYSPKVHGSIKSAGCVSSPQMMKKKARYVSPPRQQPLSKHNEVAENKLAEVPRQNLSSKSIVSFVSSNSFRRGSKGTENRQKITPIVSLASLSDSNSARTNAANSNSTTTKMEPLTTQQMEGRMQSSYSSACNATITAQHELNTIMHNQHHQTNNNATVKMELVGDDETDTKEGALKNNSLVKKISESKPNLTQSLKRRVDGSTVSAHGVGSPSLVSNEAQGYKYLEVVGGKEDMPVKVSNTPISPQNYLQKLLKARGYSTKHYCSLEGGYYCRPTELQQASYGLSVVSAVRTSNVKQLSALLSSGLSCNPCNAFGESILHMVSRRGAYDLLKCMLDNGSNVQVSDDFGRTPLHDACWTAEPCFRSIETILKKDLRLLHIVDCRASPPLEYVKKEHWAQWIAFFEGKKDEYWPVRNVSVEGDECPPPLVNVPPHSRPIKDTLKCVDLSVVKDVSSGKRDPFKVEEGIALTSKC